MSRINTNVPSLVAQNRLQRSNDDLQTALTRLSTGLRINKGADDPAGLIASEALRSEITSLNKAISNTRRASQIISTADSALSQVSNLLNDVRGLVVEAANSGALSDDEIAANQLQVDSSLEAINRIAQTTTFQGRKLLDGSLDFITAPGENFANVENLQIDQANLGATGSVDVEIDIESAATKAGVDVQNIRDSSQAVEGVKSSGEIELTVAELQADAGTITLGDSGAEFSLAVKDDGAYEGGELNGYTVNVVTDTSSSIVVDEENQTVTVTLEEGADMDDIATALDDANWAVTSETNAAITSDDAANDAATFSGGTLGGTATITVTADEFGTAQNAKTITFNEVDGTAAPIAEDDGDGNITVTIEDDGQVSIEAIRQALHNLDGFSAELDGDPILYEAGSDSSATVDFGGGVEEVKEGVVADVVFEISGDTGSEVFNVSAGTTLEDLVAQINLVKDATGVEAAANGTTLELSSTNYGSEALVDLRVIEEGEGGTFGNGGRDVGEDVVARVNGREADGNGNRLSINTATLDLSVDLAAGATDTTTFTISGGGGLFQLGPEVVSNQQARVGISSVNSARLGGPSGKMFQLGSGEDAALATDPNKASRIVNEAIDQVTNLRGRLGAFQRTTLESNLISLGDTVSNLQEAESSIRDADFAAESANLTRAQILVQSGTNVLSMANQNPQNVLALLR